MTIKFEFNLSDEQSDDLHEYRLHKQTTEMYCTLFEFKNYLRSEMKHSALSDEEYKTFETIQTKFFEILSENHVNLDM